MKRADQRKFHYIYKITRTDGSGKYYIGMHSTDDMDDGYFGSGKIITASIKKHGKEKHLKEIIEYLPTREALKLREKGIVNEELLGDKKCMNLKLGGEGGWEHIIVDVEVLRARASKGGKTGGKINGALNGLRTRFKRGDRKSCTSFLGKKHSEVSLEKMRAYQCGKHVGSKNSQFGTCWVMSGGKSTKISKSELQAYLDKGFTKGRIIKSM